MITVNKIWSKGIDLLQSEIAFLGAFTFALIATLAYCLWLAGELEILLLVFSVLSLSAGLRNRGQILRFPRILC